MIPWYYQLFDRIILVKLKALVVAHEPERQITEDEIEKFYRKLDSAKAECKSQESTILMWDLNSKNREWARC